MRLKNGAGAAGRSQNRHRPSAGRPAGRSARDTGEPPPAAAASRQARSAARRTVILDAGLVLFARHGLHGTKMEDIARQAGVSKTNLFYYFASKEAIYIALLQRLLEKWSDPLGEIAADEDPQQALAAYIRRKIAFSRSNADESRLFCVEMAQGAPLLGNALEGSVKGVILEKAAILSRWMDDGRLARVDPCHLIFALWATTQHYADFAPQIAAITGRGLEDDAFLEEAVAAVQAIVLAGLLPRADPPPPAAAG
ncbi:HTH-type transcriptional regulator RutR [Pseudoxanthobacter sp.]|uniref:HTH-type transcriptional regulator RutR n=1 Tax=Pseudoxanthobacter sp. TaxID=1925742 RepID=UPI002FE22FB9